MKALEITQYRVVSAYDRQRDGRPDPLSSVLKVKGTELLQATTELAMDVGGPMSMPIWARGTGGAVERAGCRAGVGDAGDRQLPVPARRVDLRRDQRDPEEHSDQGGAAALNSTRHSRACAGTQVPAHRSGTMSLRMAATCPAMT